MTNVKFDPLWTIAVAVFWCAVYLGWFWNSVPADIQALYYGAQLFSAGANDLVYAAASGPQAQARIAAIAQLGASDVINPFFYPPLWAYILGLLAQTNSPTAFSNALFLLQIPMIPAAAWLVFRLVNSSMRLPIWMVVSLILVSLTLSGHQSLAQNQMQITLIFLVILAFERARSHPYQAGLALALAASIKLYPALFLLIWLVQRNDKAAKSFLLCGLLLGLASIALAGWPIHQSYLDRMQEQSTIVFISASAWNLGTFIHHLTHLADVVIVPKGEQQSDHAYIRILADWRPAWLTVSLIITEIAAIAALMFRSIKSSVAWNNVALLPAFYGIVALAAPLSWAYTYLLLVLFMPALPLLWPARTGWLILIATALATATQVNLGLNTLPISLQTGMVVGTIAVLVLTMAFAFAPDLDHQNRNQPAQ